MKLYSINIEDIIFEGDCMIWKKTGKRDPLNQYISAERYERAMKFRFEADQKRSLCAGYLLNHAIQENNPELTTPVAVAYEAKNGKPYLPEYPGVYYNLSHSGDYVVCVLDTVPVGIDIEKCKSFKESVARRFFAPEEYEDIMSVQDEAKRTNRFYQYWVLKESFMKATGLGLQLDMKSFRVCMGDQAAHERAKKEWIMSEHAEKEQITYVHAVNDRGYEARLYDIAPGYCMAVCRESKELL